MAAMLWISIGAGVAALGVALMAAASGHAGRRVWLELAGRGERRALTPLPAPVAPWRMTYRFPPDSDLQESVLRSRAGEWRMAEVLAERPRGTRRAAWGPEGSRADSQDVGLTRPVTSRTSSGNVGSCTPGTSDTTLRWPSRNE